MSYYAYISILLNNHHIPFDQTNWILWTSNNYLHEDYGSYRLTAWPSTNAPHKFHGCWRLLCWCQYV